MQLIFTIVLFCLDAISDTAADSMPMNTDQPDRSMLILMDQSLLNGSGTGWLPQNTSMYAIHHKLNNWTIMNHGSVYLRYTDQNVNNPENRGENAIDAPNWFMTMWDKDVARVHLVRLRGMISLDPLTEGNDGYPLLFQTGEAFKGQPLIDRQHPHDLFMELSFTWLYHLSTNTSIFSYFGYPGEPALGPTTYMHRPSSEMNADAPLGHHWQDATHITFGVFTLGIIINKFKLDASVFTGREPDENRWNFDRPRFDSYSGRISFRFTPEIASQISAGYLYSPETVHPDINQVRFTSSIETTFRISGKSGLSNTIVYGGNLELEHGSKDFTNTILAEAEFFFQWFVPYFRYEYSQKKARDLGLFFGEEDNKLNIQSFTLGNAFNFYHFKSLSIFIGAQSTINVPDKYLKDDYGKVPFSFAAFFRIRPSVMMYHSSGMYH